MAKSPKASALVDTRVIYCGDNLDQLRKLLEVCVDLIYIDPPFNSNRNFTKFSGRAKGEALIPRSSRIDQGLHRVHAAALR